MAIAWRRMDPILARDVDIADATHLPRADPPSRKWLAELRDVGPVREAAIARLHAVLLRGAVRGRPPPARAAARSGGDFDDIANQAADDAMVAVLARLDDFRGESRRGELTRRGFSLHDTKGSR